MVNGDGMFQKVQLKILVSSLCYKHIVGTEKEPSPEVWSQSLFQVSEHFGVFWYEIQTAPGEADLDCRGKTRKAYLLSY